MIQYKNSRRIGGLLLPVLILLFINMGLTFAQNFKIKKSVVDQGGAPSQLTSYKVVDAIGQSSVIGVAIITNYRIASGFFAGGGVVVTEVVSTPTTPTGPSSGKVGQSLSFSKGGSSSNSGLSVEYQFDWGDSTPSSWGPSTQNHSYSSTGSKSVSISYCTLTINVSPSVTGSVSKNPTII